MGRTLAFLFLILASVSVACGNGDEVAERRLEVTEFMESIQWPNDYAVIIELITRDPDHGFAQNQGGMATINFSPGDASPQEIMAAFNSSITDAGFVVRSGEAHRCDADGIKVFYSYDSPVMGGGKLTYSRESDRITFQLGWDTIPTQTSITVGELPVCE